METVNRKGGMSVRQLAGQLGVSVATVSRALNNKPDVSAETRARVLEMASNSGYVPRRASGENAAIGLVYPADPVHADYGSFESAMLTGILRGVNEQRYDVSFVNVERDHHPDESYTQLFRRKGVGGVIVRSVGTTPAIAEAIADEGFPCVLVADRSDHPNVNYLCTDSKADSTRAVEHLIHLGHSRIALVIHVVMDSDHRDRRDGYLQALTRNGIGVDETIIHRGVASMGGGERAIDDLLSLEDPPTAIYITNPLTTIGAMNRCLELGIHVPDELSIVGFDDSDVRYRTFPKYTSVCQDAVQLGLEAARWLSRDLAGAGGTPLREHHPTTFSVNQSTGVCPADPVQLSSPAGGVRVGRAVVRGAQPLAVAKAARNGD
jgi:LacI family transcriptional regulator